MKIKNKKGITLVSLVITIVIMLILAGVSINLILGNNGIFKKTNYVKNAYENSSQKEQDELKQNENQLDALNENNGNNGESGTEPVPVPELPSDAVGDFVRYNVTYTDMYNQAYTFTNDDAWRYLGKDDNGNYLITTTGIPMMYFFKYFDTTNEKQPFWPTVDQVNSRYSTTYTACDKSNSSCFFEYALNNNLRYVPVRYGTTIDASNGNTTTCNTGIYVYINSNGNVYDSNYTQMLPNDIFKANNTYVSDVHEITLKEVNKVFDFAEDNISQNYLNKEAEDTTGKLNGLVYMRGLKKKDTKYNAFGNLSPNYWLGNKAKDSGISMYEVAYTGTIYARSSKADGIRPVVVLDSNRVYLKYDENGILDIVNR